MHSERYIYTMANLYTSNTHTYVHAHMMEIKVLEAVLFRIDVLKYFLFFSALLH